jgi:transposase-like protein
MTIPPITSANKRHRFPAEIISHGVWLYFRFCLSYRDVEQLMAARGVTLTYEAVRYWCRKFGQTYANALRRRRPSPGDKWHLDMKVQSVAFLTTRANCPMMACDSGTFHQLVKPKYTNP